MSNKKKILWITGDNFLEVDLPIVKKLSDNVEIVWIVFFNKNKVTSYSPESIIQIIRDFPIEIYCVELGHRLRSFSTLKKFFSTLNQFNFKKFDKIYLNYSGLPYFFFVLYFKSRKNEIIYAIHDVVLHQNFEHGKFYKFYRFFAFNFFSGFHLFSKEQLRIFKSMYPTKSAHFAPLYLQDYGEIPSNFITKKDAKTHFLFFGKIRHNKGLKYLIEAGNLLAQEYPDAFEITIAGSCGNWDEYQKEIIFDNVFNCTIRNISNEEIPILFANTHFLVLPYLDVTQSGPQLISFNYGVPVIASDLTGFKESISDKETGFLFESRNSVSLKNVMKKIIENKSDYSKMVYYIREYVDKNLSINSVTEKYSVFINK